MKNLHLHEFDAKKMDSQKQVTLPNIFECKQKTLTLMGIHRQ